MRYWIFFAAGVTVGVLVCSLAGCAAQNLTEEQRMARMRLAAQLLTPPQSQMLPTPSLPMDRCFTTINGNGVAVTNCR